ncbi:hypothetical protein CPSG_05234 [Coccidioides posadasii str. Silveira]|uniref:Uncharacterized protein n=1 Tax=Coccidioides posadasii (strain RMSCC 757 / Silveira) TaxID=443226 RepID=E9D4W6_COCPS|nr:hypothetical protein CPSG_05234 [Coccidioides posadasii str. Silveira]
MLKSGHDTVSPYGVLRELLLQTFHPPYGTSPLLRILRTSPMVALPCWTTYSYFPLSFGANQIDSAVFNRATPPIGAQDSEPRGGCPQECTIRIARSTALGDLSHLDIRQFVDYRSTAYPPLLNLHFKSLPPALEYTN